MITNKGEKANKNSKISITNKTSIISKTSRVSKTNKIMINNKVNRNLIAKAINRLQRRYQDKLSKPLKSTKTNAFRRLKRQKTVRK